MERHLKTPHRQALVATAQPASTEQREEEQSVVGEGGARAMGAGVCGVFQGALQPDFAGVTSPSLAKNRHFTKGPLARGSGLSCQVNIGAGLGGSHGAAGDSVPAATPTAPPMSEPPHSFLGCTDASNSWSRTSCLNADPQPTGDWAGFPGAPFLASSPRGSDPASTGGQSSTWCFVGAKHSCTPEITGLDSIQTDSYCVKHTRDTGSLFAKRAVKSQPKCRPNTPPFHKALVQTAWTQKLERVVPRCHPTLALEDSRPPLRGELRHFLKLLPRGSCLSDSQVTLSGLPKVYFFPPATSYFVSCSRHINVQIL